MHDPALAEIRAEKAAFWRAHRKLGKATARVMWRSERRRCRDVQFSPSPATFTRIRLVTQPPPHRGEYCVMDYDGPIYHEVDY